MYLISYNSNSNFQNLRIANEIKQKYSQWAILSSNTFIIISDDNVVAVRDCLQSHIIGGDKLFVTRVTSPAAWTGLPKEVSDWIINTYNREKNKD